MSRVVADIHCHPSMKPFANAFGHKEAKAGDLAHHIPRKGWRKLLGRLAGFTRFTQTDITSLMKGGVNVVFAAIYPMEKEFSRARPKFRKHRLIEYLFHLPTGLGRQKIRHIRNRDSGYFADAEQEYRFLEGLNGRKYMSGDKKMRYRLADNAQSIKTNEATGDAFTVNVFTTIEGGHALYTHFDDIGKDTPLVRRDVLGNIEKIKDWKYPPVFITLAHHFWNGLCGHSESIPGFFEKYKLVSQQLHLDAGISDLGKAVIRSLLDDDKRRILVDVKHMSCRARYAYYRMLDMEYEDVNIPIIASHAGVRGNRRNAHLFYNKTISFSDEELVRIGKSEGLFGIQLDRSRIASSKEIRKFRKCFTKTQVLRHASLLIWRQVQHIAEVLDSAGLPAWTIQCLGSDYDGIINPVNGVWTAAEYSSLQAHLLLHAQNYIAGEAFSSLQNEANRQITAKEIVAGFMGGNVYDFICRQDKTGVAATVGEEEYKAGVDNPEPSVKHPVYV